MDSALRPSAHQYPCFSQEIIDNILDYLWNHGPTLSSCSIVCKAWLPCCRYHLFGDVNLTPEFAKFFTQGLGSISPYIRNVAIRSLSHKDEYDEVIFFLLKLDGIRGLSFEDWSWDLLGPTSKDSLLNTKAPIFDNLTKLHLRSLQFPSCSVLMALIDRFSILEDLSFDNVIWGLEDSIDRKPYNAQHLKRLHIRSSNVQPLLAWVSGGDDSAEGISTNLSVVELPDLSLSDLGLAGGIIRRLGSSLRHLEVGFLDNVDGGMNVLLAPKQ
ncbi:hypothetical protein H0H93_004566 [Arthromyces matolae]|nr:hypothetical protein H0H93_004566 [Arthromyces matolae]